MSKKLTVAVLGAGNMGTAIAYVVARNGYPVKLWNHAGDPEPLKQIRRFQENKKYLAGIKLPANLHPEADLAKALADAAVVFFVVPSNFMEGMIKQAARYLAGGVICVDASKGLDEKSLFLVPDLMNKDIPVRLHRSIVTISGPAIAREMAEGNFTAMNVSSVNARAIATVKKLMENKNLKLAPTADMTGVEVAGSFKNVYAIAMGVCDGLQLGMNAKAALLVLALKEIGRLIEKMGGRRETVYDLAGLGDLVGTGLCAISRNRRFGEYLAKGLKREQAVKRVGQTVEGINASRILYLLGRKHGVKMPFAATVYGWLWKQKPAAKGLIDFFRSYR